MSSRNGRTVGDASRRFGERLRAVREHKRMTQSDVGGPLGFDRATVSRIESGKRTVTLDEAWDLAGVVGVPFSEMCSPGPMTVDVRVEMP